MAGRRERVLVALAAVVSVGAAALGLWPARILADDAAPAPSVPHARTPAPAKEVVGAATRAAAPVERCGSGSPPARAADLRVRVVDAATDRPIAGAEVWFAAAAPAQAPPGAARWQTSRALRWPEPPSDSPVGRSAADGMVCFAALGTTATVCGRAGNLCGEVALPASAAPREPLTLRLSPRRRLTVVALDAFGNPCPGVSVALRRGSAATTPLGVTSAASGRLDLDLEPWCDRAGPAEVGLDEPGLAWSGVPFELAAPPVDIVYLQAKATGTLRVQVVTGDGAAAPAGLDVQLATLDPAAGPSRFLRACHVAATDANGCAEFARVGLGQRLWVRLDVPGRSAVRELDGPADGATPRCVTCVLPEPRAWVRGRATDGIGAVVAGQQLVLEYCAGDPRRPRTACAATGDDGQFAFAIADQGARVLAAARVALVQGGALTDRVAVLGDVELPPTGVFGDVDLRDVQLQDAPVLATGRFVGDAAAGDIALWVERSDAPGEPCAAVFVERAAATFAVRGATASAELRLLAERAGTACAAPIEFSPGARGLVLVLDDSGSTSRAIRATSLLGAEPRTSDRAARANKASSAR